MIHVFLLLVFQVFYQETLGSDKKLKNLTEEQLKNRLQYTYYKKNPDQKLRLHYIDEKNKSGGTLILENDEWNHGYSLFMNNKKFTEAKVKVVYKNGMVQTLIYSDRVYKNSSSMINKILEKYTLKPLPEETDLDIKDTLYTCQKQVLISGKNPGFTGLGFECIEDLVFNKKTKEIMVMHIDKGITQKSITQFLKKFQGDAKPSDVIHTMGTLYRSQRLLEILKLIEQEKQTIQCIYCPNTLREEKDIGESPSPWIIQTFTGDKKDIFKNSNYFEKTNGLAMKIDLEGNISVGIVDLSTIREIKKNYEYDSPFGGKYAEIEYKCFSLNPNNVPLNDQKIAYDLVDISDVFN